MTRHRPHHIQDHHLTRLAVVYRRKGYPQEVVEQSGPPAGPSHALELVIHWGWPEQAILAIDAARSASSFGADSPDGFTRLCELVAQKQVGIIMMSIISSLPPSSSDLLRLFDLCRGTNTLVAIDGAVIQLDRWTDHLLTDTDATTFTTANRRRGEVIAMVKRRYATQGRAVSNPPTGYIKLAKGQWGKDIPAVQERIEAVFRLYNSFGSVGKVIRFLAAQGLDMPLRTPSGDLRWVRPTEGRIYGMPPIPHLRVGTSMAVMPRCRELRTVSNAKQRRKSRSSSLTTMKLTFQSKSGAGSIADLIAMRPSSLARRQWRRCIE